MSRRTSREIPTVARRADGSTTVMSAFTRELLQMRCGLAKPLAPEPAGSLQLDESADHAATWSAGSQRRMLALVVYVLLLWSAVVIKTVVW